MTVAHTVPVRDSRKFVRKKVYSRNVRIEGSYNSGGQFAESFKQQVTNMFDKMGVSNRLELALFALQKRLVFPAIAVRPARPRPR